MNGINSTEEVISVEPSGAMISAKRHNPSAFERIVSPGKQYDWTVVVLHGSFKETRLVCGDKTPEEAIQVGREVAAKIEDGTFARRRDREERLGQLRILAAQANPLDLHKVVEDERFIRRAKNYQP